MTDRLIKNFIIENYVLRKAANGIKRGRKFIKNLSGNKQHISQLDNRINSIQDTNRKIATNLSNKNFTNLDDLEKNAAKTKENIVQHKSNIKQNLDLLQNSNEIRRGARKRQAIQNIRSSVDPNYEYKPKNAINRLLGIKDEDALLKGEMNKLKNTEQDKTIKNVFRDENLKPAIDARNAKKSELNKLKDLQNQKHEYNQMISNTRTKAQLSKEKQDALNDVRAARVTALKGAAGLGIAGYGAKKLNDSSSNNNTQRM